MPNCQTISTMQQRPFQRTWHNRRLYAPSIPPVVRGSRPGSVGCRASEDYLYSRDTAPDKFYGPIKVVKFEGGGSTGGVVCSRSWDPGMLALPQLSKHVRKRKQLNTPGGITPDASWLADIQHACTGPMPHLLLLCTTAATGLCTAHLPHNHHALDRRQRARHCSHRRHPARPAADARPSPSPGRCQRTAAP
jgi:hypothetical protein